MPRIRARTKRGEDAKEYNLAECPKLTLVLDWVNYTYDVYKNGALIGGRSCEWRESVGLAMVKEFITITKIPCRIIELDAGFVAQLNGGVADLFPTIDRLDKVLAEWDKQHVQVAIPEE